jgi:hypothetical protein
MSSKPKSDAARINGAKSHGPVTPEGRAKSSANSRKHGLAAKYALLPDESAAEFQLLFDDYTDQFHPQTGVETELVEVMVIARWRLRRLLAIETNLFETEISRRGKQIDREFTALGEDPRLAWVFQKLADNGQSITLLIRYEGAINRSYEKALKQLLLLQSPSLKSRAPTPPPSQPWVRSAVPPDPQPNQPPPNDGGRRSCRRAGLAPNHDWNERSQVRIQQLFNLHRTFSIPTPRKPPFRPRKPTPNVNPTIPVRDSVS